MGTVTRGTSDPGTVTRGTQHFRWVTRGMYRGTQQFLCTGGQSNFSGEEEFPRKLENFCKELNRAPSTNLCKFSFLLGGFAKWRAFRCGIESVFNLAKMAKMTRLTREQLFTPDEQAIVHVMNRAVRRCFLMGVDEFTGRNYDYRKVWIESRIEHLAKYFGIDVLTYSILSNHFHLVLRQRPDVVKTCGGTVTRGTQHFRWVTRGHSRVTRGTQHFREGEGGTCCCGEMSVAGGCTGAGDVPGREMYRGTQQFLCTGDKAISRGRKNFPESWKIFVRN